MLHLRALLFLLAKSKLIAQLLSTFQWLAMSKLVALEDRILQSLIKWWKAPKKAPAAWKAFTDFEDLIINKFADVCQSRHWSFFWIVYFISWTIFREFFPHPWYTDAIDLLIITWSSAVVPFWVENSMKVSQALQLKKQNEQIELLEEGQEVLTKLVTLNAEMSNKILAALDEPTVNIEEEVSSNDGTNESQ